MNREFKVSLIALIVQIIELIICLWGLISDYNLIFFLFLCLLVFSSVVFCVIGIRHYNLLQYVYFIEYLMHNEKHKFVLLPKIKMYLHSQKINNQLKIKEININYDVEYHKPDNPNEVDNLLGDMTIEYKLIIENKNIPDEFNFIYGNDYSKLKQEVSYCYGTNHNYLAMPEKPEQVAPYWRGSLKFYKFGIDRRILPQEGDFEINIIIKCNKAFVFKGLPRDTIICLPEIFSRDIQTINYKLKFSGYGEEIFYCDAYKICKTSGKFDTIPINYKKIGKNLFEASMYPNDIKGEKAYYFRVGLSETDLELTNQSN